MRFIKFISSLGIWHIKDALSGQSVSIAAGLSLEPHCVWMSATLNDAVYHPNLEIIVKAVPHAA
jgi:hypothetical protein